MPPFPGLRRFPQGRRFKQWTGDWLQGSNEGNSHELYVLVHSCWCISAGFILPPFAEYLPEAIMKSLSAFMDFCYLVQAIWLWWKHPDSGQEDNPTIPSLSWGFQALWCPWWLLASSTTCYRSLPQSHHGIWCPKWTLFIYYRIPTHNCSQEALETV